MAKLSLKDALARKATNNDKDGIYRQIQTLQHIPSFQGASFSPVYSFLPDSYHNADARDWISEECTSNQTEMTPPDPKDSPFYKYLMSSWNAGSDLSDAKYNTLLDLTYLLDAVNTIADATNPAHHKAVSEEEWSHALDKLEKVNDLADQLDKFNASTNYSHLVEPGMQALLGYVRYAQKVNNSISLKTDLIEMQNKFTPDVENYNSVHRTLYEEALKHIPYDHNWWSAPETANQVLDKADAEHREIVPQIKKLTDQQIKRLADAEAERIAYIKQANHRLYRAKLGVLKCENESANAKQKNDNVIKEEYSRYRKKQDQTITDDQLNSELSNLETEADNLKLLCGYDAQSFKKIINEESNLISEAEAFNRDTFKADSVKADVKTPKYLLKYIACGKASSKINELKENEKKLHDFRTHIIKKHKFLQSTLPADKIEKGDDPSYMPQKQSDVTDEYSNIPNLNINDLLNARDNGLGDPVADSSELLSVPSPLTDAQIEKDNDFISRFIKPDLVHSINDKRFTTFEKSAAELYTIGAKAEWGGKKRLGDSPAFTTMKTALQNLHDKPMTKDTLTEARAAAKQYLDAKKHGIHWIKSPIRKFRLDLAERTIQLADRALAAASEVGAENLQKQKMQDMASRLQAATAPGVKKIHAKVPTLIDDIQKAYNYCDQMCKEQDKQLDQKAHERANENEPVKENNLINTTLVNYISEILPS